MTLIVGIVDNGTITMGSDSCVTDGWENRSLAGSKIVQKDDMLIGVSGTIRLLNVIQYDLKLPVRDPDWTNDQYMYDVCEELRRLCVNRGYVVEKDHLQTFDASILIGYRGKLYYIDGAFGVTSVSDNHQSAGSGKYIALGALEAYNRTIHSNSAEETIIKVLQIAETFNPNVQSPFEVKVLEPATV